MIALEHIYKNQLAGPNANYQNLFSQILDCIQQQHNTLDLPASHLPILPIIQEFFQYLTGLVIHTNMETESEALDSLSKCSFSELTTLRISGAFCTTYKKSRKPSKLMTDYKKCSMKFLRNMQMPKLQTLYISGIIIDCDISLKNCILPNLHSLSLSRLPVEAMQSILSINLPKLTHLTLNNSLFSDLSLLTKLKSCKQLEYLSLRENSIEDLSVLATIPFTNLKELSLYKNKISDLTPLTKASLESLKELSVCSNPIKNLDALQLKYFPNLTHLGCIHHTISKHEIRENEARLEAEFNPDPDQRRVSIY